MSTLEEIMPRTDQMEDGKIDRSHADVNVSPTERAIAGAVGGLLLARVVSGRSNHPLISGVVGGMLVHRAITGHCAGYEALGINNARLGKAEPQDFFDHGIHVECAVTINKSPEELYRFWRNLENLPAFMTHLDEVKVSGDKDSHWVARGPAGKSVVWDAAIINDEENHLIAWRSKEGADVDNAGTVRFLPAPGNRGTEVKVTLEYIPPFGKVGSLVARLFGEEPQQQVQDDLRRFQQMMEAGEIATVDGQPRGSCR